MSEIITVEQLNHSFDVGISSGYERAALFVLDKTTAIFRQGKDKEANELRKLSDELSKEGQHYRKTHPEEEPAIEEAEK